MFVVFNLYFIFVFTFLNFFLSTFVSYCKIPLTSCLLLRRTLTEEARTFNLILSLHQNSAFWFSPTICEMYVSVWGSPPAVFPRFSHTRQQQPYKNFFCHLVICSKYLLILLLRIFNELFFLVHSKILTIFWVNFDIQVSYLYDVNNFFLLCPVWTFASSNHWGNVFELVRIFLCSQMYWVI